MKKGSSSKKNSVARLGKRGYRPPTLERYGDVSEITKVDVDVNMDGFLGNSNPSGT